MTSTPEPTAKPQRGWRRGLVIAGVVLLVSLVLRDRDRAASPPRPTLPAPVAAPGPLPADASLGAPSQARPRLLALLPRRADQPAEDDLGVRLRQVCADRIALTEGDEQVAKALGIGTLPSFILYSAAGGELKRLSGPDAVKLLAAELRALGVATTGLAAEEGTP
jgi:hypothetical protein